MKDKHFLIKDFTNPFVINLVITQVVHNMVFKTSGSQHGIQNKWFTTWYPNQVVQNMVFKFIGSSMVFKSSCSHHGIQIKRFISCYINKGFNSWS